MHRNFKQWFLTFLSEKNIDLETIIEVKSDNNTPNFIPVGAIVEFCDNQHKVTKASIKTTFVKIDFRNGDTMHFLTHLAKGMAKDF